MFEQLSDRLDKVFSRLRGRGLLSESEVDQALREVRIALLEADVALPVVKDFIAAVREKAVGEAVLKSVKPGQQVVKIVHDELVRLLGGEEGARNLDLGGTPPAVVMMVGLQGSGKTTTTAKIARLLTAKEGRRVLMASLDTRRPAAQEQLAVLGEEAGIETLAIVPGQDPQAITRRALETARFKGFDVLLLDTAGRLHVDEALMGELKAVAGIAAPRETLLVVDAMTGQDAVEIARHFDTALALTGVVLTRMDGDARGGAALSMRAITGKPIVFMGTGEKLDQIERFDPARVAGRILGMGDIVALVEKAAEAVKADEAERMARKLQKGQFDLEDLRTQLRQMQKMGGLKGLLQLLPGVKGMMKGIKAGVDDRMIRRQEAIINSMTPAERRNPKLLNASRKRRIAAGSGTSVQEVNRLLKQYQQMAGMFKRMRKMGALPSPEEMGAMGDPASLAGGVPPTTGPGGLPGLPGAGGMPAGGGIPPDLARLLRKKR